ncbi:GNAT family N-acetyltransferase [Zongyangia hominis]|uniref:GNAT family N-acetyltransferase n=1 Tax=Zongyangia hominis TaxID=2763677 RepID=A0A926E8Q3_9FIRM|nr:GNAT family N-acetyltransferase [Zongyangia hominis]MBC8569377.1 GNAT family N-acetyltransferase [Zongyangia hominis]
MLCMRDIERKDHDAFVEMVVDFYGGGAALYGANMEHIEKTFEAIMEKCPYLRAVMIEQEEKIMGFALLAYTWSNESGGMVVWLEELYVKPGYQGQKIGSQFLRWMEKEYADFSRIRLEVCPSNPGARRLYERFGFETLDYIQMIKDKK